MRMAEMGETEKRRIGGGGRNMVKSMGGSSSVAKMGGEEGRMVKSIKMAAAVLLLSLAAVAGNLVFHLTQS